MNIIRRNIFILALTLALTGCASGSKLGESLSSFTSNFADTFTAFTHGNKWTGQYLDGKRYGSGVYTLPNKDRFLGTYDELGEIEPGYGEYTFARGGTVTGTFTKDMDVVSPAMYKYENDGVVISYVGNFRNRKFDGAGTYSIKSKVVVNYKGIPVMAVKEKSIAAKIGLKAGYVITKVNGHKTPIIVGDITSKVQSFKGNKFTITYLDGTKEVSKEVNFRKNLGIEFPTVSTSFVGKWKDGSAMLGGNWKWEDGSQFIGLEASGEYNLIGLSIHSNGSLVKQFRKNGSVIFEVPIPVQYETSLKKPSCLLNEGMKFYGACKANRPNGKGVALGDDYSFQSGNFNAGVLEKGEVYDGNKMQYSGSWNAGKLHGNGKIISMSKELYNGGFLHGKRHGNGVCNGGEQPIRCEYFYDRRVDTVYLAEAFNKDLNVFNQTFRKNKAQVNRKHDAIENRWQQSKRSKLDGYDNRISRYETELVTIGALDMFSAGLAAQNSGGNTNQAMAARSEKYGRKIEQARVDKEKARVRLEREYQQKKPEWDRKRAQDLQKILAEFELKRRDFIAKNAKFCQSIPNKKWVGEPEFLCKSI